MNVEIICPLYEAEPYLKKLHASFLMQKNVALQNIHYILTESNDNTLEVLKSLDHCHYDVINKEQFSHSLTRETAAFSSTADIIVFVTQDVIILKDDWLYHLVQPIINGECEASFSRQICDDNRSIEKYIREYNYPDQSVIKSENDIATMGLNTFFFSDVASAVRKDVFVQLKGYDHIAMAFNEDMYFAHKLITNHYRIKYCADSEVIHYHNQTLKQLADRYQQSGTFFKQFPEFNKYGTNSSGAKLAKYILKRAFEDKNIKVILEWLPNMTTRFISMKLASKSK